MKKIKNEKVKGAEAKVEKPKRVRQVPVAVKKEAEKSVEVKVEKSVNIQVKLPVFEHKQVLKVLEGGHTKTHFHCEMEGGVSMHVPKSRFN